MTRLSTDGGVVETTHPASHSSRVPPLPHHANPNSLRPGRGSPQDLGVLVVDRRRQRSIADPANNRIQGDGHNFIGRKPHVNQGSKPQLPPLQSQKVD